MESKIIMLRLVGGEFIIGKEDTSTIVDENSNVCDTSNKIRLTDVRVLNMQMTQRGVAIAFIPLFPFTQSPISSLNTTEIDKSIVLLTIPEQYIDGEMLNSYKSNISGIDLSAANKNNIII